MFEDGLAPVWDELTSPAFIHALQVTLIIVAIAVPANTIFGILLRARHRPSRLRRAATGSSTRLIGLPLALSPVVVGLSA